MKDPDLAQHQAQAVKKLSNGKILKGGVGSGKTRTALAYYVKAGFPPWTSLYVITTAKKRDSGDWQEEAKLWGCVVTVDSWNNIDEYAGVKDAFFIFDEQRVVGSGAWVRSFLTITLSNRWILLSATPGDTWLDYVPVFIANGFHKNRTQFLQRHVVYSPFAKFPKVQRYIDEEYLQACLRRVLVNMPYQRHTKRKQIDVYAEHDRELYKRVSIGRWNYLEDRPIRSTGELFSLMRRVSNSDPSRLERTKEIIEKHGKVIVFYNFDYELDALKTLSGLGYQVAEWNGHRHQPVPDGENWVYLVQYAAGAEGWNCITTDTMVLYSQNYSYRATEQARGRIDRLNTPFTDLLYYNIKSSSAIDNGIKKALDTKKDFSEAKFLRKSV